METKTHAEVLPSWMPFCGAEGARERICVPLKHIELQPFVRGVGVGGGGEGGEGMYSSWTLSFTLY